MTEDQMKTVAKLCEGVAKGLILVDQTHIKNVEVLAGLYAISQATLKLSKMLTQIALDKIEN